MLACKFQHSFLLAFCLSLSTTSFVDRDMLMRFRGGGVGHTGTRAATNKFLEDRDQLDVDNGHMQGGDDEEGSHGDSEEDSDNDPDEGQPEGGSEKVVDDEGNSSCDEEYGYGYSIDDEDGDEPPDVADDALGPEDGEGDVDEVSLLGFAAF
jgi:hypothetical protein